jgi:hypothetical protein
MASRYLGLFIVVLLLGATARADHLPENLLARGRPEKMLASVHLNRSKLSDVVRAHGKPSKVEGDDYYWVKNGWTLHLLVYRGDGIVHGEYIAMIEIEGSNVPRSIGRTGGGLRLGDTIFALRRIYGKRFKERTLPKINIHDVMVQWRKEEVSLVAKFDRHGKINNLQLFAPE